MRVLTCVLVLSTGAALVAQERAPAQPEQPKVVRPVQPGPNQPGPPPVRVTPAARLAQLEEEVETLEAARDVRRGHLRLAELNVARAGAAFERVKVLHEAKGGQLVSAADVEGAKFDLETTKIQFEIRAAEVREVEVRLKYAKRRLEEAKQGGARPAPGGRPADPKPVAPERGR